VGVGTDAVADRDGFRHEALFYAGLDDFVDFASAFIRDGVEAGEPVLTVVSAEKVEALRKALGNDAAGAHFADMAEVGANPARIIPAWRAFVGAGDVAVRGIGEPINADRAPAELVECHHHEALLNLAFADACHFWLVCPYDTLALDDEVLVEAQRTHPGLAEGPLRWESGRYGGLETSAERHYAPLPEPPARVLLELSFGGDDFRLVREAILDRAAANGLGRGRANDLALAGHEIATNSVRHGGGSGRLRLWRDNGSLICELTDHGHLNDPLAGRERPAGDGVDGYGLWMANQLCDLVQLRALSPGTVVRLHMRTV
jgi:anti-sigma regulatory factor (Ser/Thr protein kinase)